jgi:hypothetical protein
VEGVRSKLKLLAARGWLSGVPGDPFTVSKGMFAALADELSGPAAAGLTADEVEDFIDQRGRDALLQLLQDHVDLRAQRKEQQARKHPGRWRAPTASPGPGWRPGTGGSWPPCSAR